MLLSVDHADYYRSRFQEAAPECLAGRNSEFLGLVQFAKALDRANAQLAALSRAEADRLDLAGGAEAYDLWFRANEETPGGATLLGFALDTDWVDRHLVSRLPPVPPVQPPIEGTWVFWWLIFAVAVTMILVRISSSARLGGISHDMKNPLAVIQNETEELIEDPSLDAPQRMANYHAILRQTANLRSSIEKALELARQDLRRAGLEQAVQDALPLLECVAEEFRRTLRDRQVSLITEFAPDLPRVRIHADSIRRAIWNLLDNAAKYSVPPATVRLRARPFDHWLAIEFEDQGIGIPARRRSGAARSVGSSAQEERQAMRRKRTTKPSMAKRTSEKSDWRRVDAQTDDDIRRAIQTDPTAAPEMDRAWFGSARVVMPEPKQAVSLRLDRDVMEWFKKQGKGYQTRINAMLRAYVNSQR
mgnify:CR=1 FL=1